MEVLRHYGPAYITPVGTMSSAATLAIVLKCAQKSKVLYGKIPEVDGMVLFCMFLGVFVIGALGSSGGTVMASLGLITSILGFDATGTALRLTIFALQDSFGTLCNVIGDGALHLMFIGYAEKNDIEEIDEPVVL